jgi:ABC-type transport system involved in cytochrome c biogenesis permease subunit
MKTILQDIRDFLVSLKLTVALLVFGMVLVFAATLDQANLGVWGIQQKWFHTFVVFQDIRGVMLPIYPGGYLVGGLLLLNLIAAHIDRFKFTWRKAGIFLTHAGLILLLVGELLSGIWQQDFNLRLSPGETRNYAESYRFNELAITDTTNPNFDDVVTIPDAMLSRHASVQHPKLPFRVVTRAWYPNSFIQARAAGTPSLATAGIGLNVDAVPQPVTYKADETNTPTAYVELSAPDASPGIFLVSTGLLGPQHFDYAGRSWSITLRPHRIYLPFSITLLKFSHDNYAGTDIPKNFSSRVRVTTSDGRNDREVLIYMNSPLRYGGLTFYQAGFENNDRATILQVVRNPSWILPYIACGLMAFGLIGQFGIHLLGFVQKKSRQKLGPGRGVKSLFPAFVVLTALIAVAGTLRAPQGSGAYDTVAFGRLPTLVNGRLKPLDTVARTSLLVMQGRQRVTTPDGRTLSPDEWLLDVLFQPTLANGYQTFEIVHPDALTLFNLTREQGAGQKRFSFDQLRPGLPELERQSKLADATDAPVRTAFQRAVIQLRDNVLLYQSLQVSFVPPGVDGYLDQLISFERTLPAAMDALNAQRAGRPHDSAATKRMLEMSQNFAAMDTLGYLLPIPPETGMENPSAWKSAGSSLQDSLTTGRINPAAAAFGLAGAAWCHQQPATFNSSVSAYRARLDLAIPTLMTKSDVESRFNSTEPFYTSAILYFIAFLLGIFSWLKWPDRLGRAAFWLVGLSWLLTTAGILTRMWLEGRPPVTNLYSSALFVGWGAVALCLVLEYFYRNAIGSVAAGLIGFCALVIAHHLALGGDTMEMMRAVLDSNFWLATHVVTVTVGYAATFLAGFLALIYVGRGVFTRTLDSATADALTRMIYGIVCFATLFSFVGTVLGGIWADQSWGRFWGWDPKENGALIIVLWNSIILHARWGGLIKQRGLAIMAIFGNVVTSWSWFGVNMLGVGLHSYGFMDGAFWWLIAFVASQVAIIGVAGLPPQIWRSFPRRQAA